ncbi:hypothetical protein D3C87_43260 [compost metagenome]
MKTQTRISLANIVSNTETNIEGVKLFCVITKAIRNDESLILEIDSHMALSSSFLNSALGEIIDNYSLDVLKSCLRIESSKTQFERINSYLIKYNNIYHN